MLYNWISDVEDPLPSNPMFEVPENIGFGERWGMELEATLPLNSLGLSGVRLDIEARLQDSSLTAPDCC